MSSNSCQLFLKEETMAVLRKFVGHGMGSGLFAARDVVMGEVLLEEEPLVFVSDTSALPTQCGYCHQPESQSPAACAECKEVFCSASCLDKAQERFHPIECLGSPHGARMQKFKQYVMKSGWYIGLAIGRVLFHMLLAFLRSQSEGEGVLAQYMTFCSASITDSLESSERDAVLLEMSTQFRLFQGVFSRKERLGWPPAFRSQVTLRAWLRWAGMWNLNNQENGLYVVQSSLNHSCVPNVLVLHPHGSTCGLKLVANQTIAEGEQLFHCYCPPHYLGRAQCARREYLWRSYHFWCQCIRCQAHALRFSKKQRADELG